MKKNFTVDQVKAMATTSTTGESVFGKSNERLLSEDLLQLYSEIHELKQDIKDLKAKKDVCDKTEDVTTSQKIHIDDLLKEINILRGEIAQHLQDYHNTSNHLHSLQLLNSELTTKVLTFKKR